MPSIQYVRLIFQSELIPKIGLNLMYIRYNSASHKGSKANPVLKLTYYTEVDFSCPNLTEFAKLAT